MTRAEVWLTYRGTNRAGNAVVGSTDMSSLAFVQRCFRNRWATLEVYRGSRQTGGIGRHDTDGRRVWWSEGDR